jgi:hypothetical protein
MRWSGDLGDGAWIAHRIGGWGTVCSTSPTGFEAYARVLHPFRANRGEEAVEWTWAELARRTGRALHPLAQAANLLGTDSQTTMVDGWEVGIPEQGFLAPEQLAALVQLLHPATTPPDDATIAIWSGWGELHSSAQVGVVGVAVDPAIARALEAHVELSLPGREYVLLRGTLDELADTTIVAGPRRLVDAVLASPALEAFDVPEDGDLSEDGDLLHPRPRPS